MIAANDNGRAVATPRETGNEGRGQRSMHDMRPGVEGGAGAANLAAAFGLTTAQIEAVLPLVAAELGACLEQATLSRAGLVAFIEGLGGRWATPLDRCDALHSLQVRADGDVALEEIVGSRDRVRALRERVERAGRLGEGRADRVLPALAAVTMSRWAARARDSLAEVVWAMPPLGRWSQGEPHLDLADILRRRCGAGPHGPVELRRVVRRAVAHAAGFEPTGPLRWYLRFIGAPVVVPMRWALDAVRSGG